MARPAKKKPGAGLSRPVHDSAANLRLAAAHNETAFNNLWKCYNRCPMFIAKPNLEVREGKDGKTAGQLTKERIKKYKEGKLPVRTRRFISQHALSTLGSFAGYHTAKNTQTDSDMLRTTVNSESARGPFYPALQKSYGDFLQHFLSAYVHECIHNARTIRKAVDKHKKLTAKSVALGAEIANSSIYSALRPSGHLVYRTVAKPRVVGFKKKTKPKAGPPAEAEGAHEAAAA